MKFKVTKFNGGLAEIGQQLNIRMAFGIKSKDGQYTNSHPFVKCRDFLGDTLDAIEQKRTNSIYGFKYNPTKQKINHKETTLILEFPNEETYKTFLGNIYYLHDIEANNKCKKTTVRSLSSDDHKYYALVRASNFWLKSIFNISFYTFALKSLGYPLGNSGEFLKEISKTTVDIPQWDNTIGTHKTNEANYADQVRDTFKIILYKLKAVNKGLPSVTGCKDTLYISNVHNNHGFVSICKQKPAFNKLTQNILKLL